jgi:hypothetical protein
MWACKPAGAAQAATKVSMRYFEDFICCFFNRFGFFRITKGAHAVRVK